MKYKTRKELTDKVYNYSKGTLHNLQYGDADIAISAVWEYIEGLQTDNRSLENRVKILCKPSDKDKLKHGNEQISDTDADQEEAFQEATRT